MKKGLAVLIVLGCIFFSFTAPKPGELSNFSFSAGEKLVYKIFYNWNFVWIPAGEITLEVKDDNHYYHIEVTGKTYPSYEWFYKVRDKYHSYIDKKTGLPKLYIRDIQQGDYRQYEKIIFDYEKNIATCFTGKTMNDLKSVELNLDKNYYDMISSMYFLRNINLDKLKTHNKTGFNIILDNEKYELSLQYKAEKDNLKIKDSGTYKASHLVADVIAGKVFKSGVQMNFWIAQDSNALPVLLESPLIVGSVKGVLSSYSNLKYPFLAKTK